jgi:hypothetical protein
LVKYEHVVGEAGLEFYWGVWLIESHCKTNRVVECSVPSLFGEGCHQLCPTSW